MSLPLHPDHLAASYDMLRTMPPFNRWKMPPSDEVMFVVNRSIKNRGTYFWDGRRHVITVSSHYHKRTMSLVETMAHEMVHLVEEKAGGARQDVQHSAKFMRMAKQVCRVHGFDEAVF